MKTLTDEEIQAKIQQLIESPIIYEWEHTGFSGSKSNTVKWMISLSFTLLTSVIFVPMTIDFGDSFSINWLALSTFGVMILLGTLMFRYVFTADTHYIYKLTQYGIYYTEDVLIPSIVYTIFRRAGWVGVAVCIVGVFVIGPMAFVGVGAVALLSFPLTKIKPVIKHSSILFPDEAWVLFYKKDKEFDIFSLDMKMDHNNGIFNGTFYYQNLEEIKHILENTIKVVYFDEAESMDTIEETPEYLERSNKRILKMESEDRKI